MEKVILSAAPEVIEAPSNEISASVEIEIPLIEFILNSPTSKELIVKLSVNI